MYIAPEDRIITRDIAALCGVTVQTINRWTRNGKMPAPMKISERIRYWRRSDIFSFLGIETGL